MADPKAIAVVGTGLVGCGWAIVFARAGYQVVAYDADAASLGAMPGRIRASLADMQSFGLVEDPDAIAARITPAADLASAVERADYIQESVFERRDAKAAICAEIDALMRPETIVGSSSSGIPASEFTEPLANRGRFLIVHPVNPPHLIPLVELVPSPWTDPAAVTQVRALMETVGQTPVTVRREIDGFVLNRLQGALLNEAFALYQDGYATAEDIDRTVRDGLGLRWSFMGPMETIDLNAPAGIADYARRLGPLYHSIASMRSAPQPWSEPLIAALEAERRQSLAADELAERRDWRDRNLMALLAHRRARSGDPH